jgi:hypothetical protein
MSIVVFGEAERGAYTTPWMCASLEHLLDQLGTPPEGSQGISYGIQTLLYRRRLIYFRVEEEGFSMLDYLGGFQWLQKNALPTPLFAICLPGVGDKTILDAVHPLCFLHQACLVLSEKDLYDYLTL